MRNKARTAIIDTLQYFGEDSNKLLGTEEFFGVFSTFLKQFEVGLNSKNVVIDGKLKVTFSI